MKGVQLYRTVLLSLNSSKVVVVLIANVAVCVRLFPLEASFIGFWLGRCRGNFRVFIH